MNSSQKSSPDTGTAKRVVGTVIGMPPEAVASAVVHDAIDESNPIRDRQESNVGISGRPDQDSKAGMRDALFAELVRLFASGEKKTWDTADIVVRLVDEQLASLSEIKNWVDSLDYEKSRISEFYVVAKLFPKEIRCDKTFNLHANVARVLRKLPQASGMTAQSALTVVEKSGARGRQAIAAALSTSCGMTLAKPTKAWKQRARKTYAPNGDQLCVYQLPDDITRSYPMLIVAKNESDAYHLLDLTRRRSQRVTPLRLLGHLSLSRGFYALSDLPRFPIPVADHVDEKIKEMQQLDVSVIGAESDGK